MRLLLDCDGVLADFVGCVLEWHNAPLVESRKRTRESITNWDIFKAWGLPDLWPAFNAYVGKQGVCANLEVLPGAVQFVQELRKRSDEIVIATSPYKGARHWIHERIEWLDTHFGFRPDDVCVWSRKSWIDACVLIDDSLSNALSFEGAGGVVFLLDAPYNQCAELPVNVVRCIGYDQVLRELDFYMHAGATSRE